MAYLNLSTVESYKIKFQLYKLLDYRLIIGALVSYPWVPSPPNSFYISQISNLVQILDTMARRQVDREEQDRKTGPPQT
jgi:hypothetical protein